MCISKTIHLIFKYFWAKDLLTQITHRVKSLVGYQVSEIPTIPFQKVFIVHIGPLSKNYNLLTIVDAFSKFTIVIPMRNTKAYTIVTLLTKNLSFWQFRFPKLLVMDNIPSFKSHKCVYSLDSCICTSPISCRES